MQGLDCPVFFSYIMRALVRLLYFNVYYDAVLRWLCNTVRCLSLLLIKIM